MSHPCTDPVYWLPRAAGGWTTGCGAGGSSARGDPPLWWSSGPHWPPPPPSPPTPRPQGDTSSSHQCVATIYILCLAILKTWRHDVKMLLIVWYSRIGWWLWRGLDWNDVVEANKTMERELDLTPAAGSAAPHCSHSNGIHQTQRITQPQFGGFKYEEMFKIILATVSTLGAKSYGVCQNVEKNIWAIFSKYKQTPRGKKNHVIHNSWSFWAMCGGSF